MPTDLELKAGVLTTKRSELAKVFADHTTPTGGYDMTAEQVEDCRSRMTEINALGEAYQVARDIDSAASENKHALDILNEPVHPSRHSNGRLESSAGGNDPVLEQKSLGQLVLGSLECKNAFAAKGASGQLRPFVVDIPNFNVKTVMTETVAGYAPPNYRTNIVVFSAQRKPIVSDLIPSDPTEKEAIKYMEETTFTNNAVMTAEGSASAEAALAYTERTVLVEWLPLTLPVTEQQLDDVPQLNGIINNRLTLMIGQAEETELVSGSGSSPHLQGFLTKSGIQTQALGSDPIPDAIMKAMTLVRWTAFAEPSGIIMHPTNWQTIRLLKTTTGQYLWGSPSEPGPERVWGLPAILTTAMTLNTALVGDYLKFSHISRRLGLRVEVGFVNDDFKKGQKTLRAQERLSLEIYRAAAFCTITGLN